MNCRCGATRPVSCYALLQGWLLLSQPPGCLRGATALATEPEFGDLSWCAGLLPFRRRRLAPAASLVRALALAFAVWLGLVTATRPRAQSVLYLQGSPMRTAAPPCISGRTSYLRVRLEFLRCPQVIPSICNLSECGPRRAVTRAAPCPWEDHAVSGRMDATSSSPSSDLLSLRLVVVGGPSPGRAHALAGSYYKRHAIRHTAL
jgi:hypothetical protein